MKHTAYFRDTRFEIHQIHQGPNGWGIVCSDRTVKPKVENGKLVATALPPLEVNATRYTQEQNDLIIEAFRLLELGFADAYDAYAKDPARLTEAVAVARRAEVELAETTKRIEAAKLEHAKLELDLISKRAEAEEFATNMAAIRAAAKGQDGT
jgi:hypothetical protein